MPEADETTLHYLEYYEDFLAKVRFLAGELRLANW